MDELRAFTAARVELATLATVAEEIGISATALREFLRGRSPYARTRGRLTEWWARRQGLLTRLSAPGIARAIDSVLAGVPVERRSDVLAEVTGVLRGLHAAHDGRCPAWVAELLQATDVGAGPVAAGPGR